MSNAVGQQKQLQHRNDNNSNVITVLSSASSSPITTTMITRNRKQIKDLNEVITCYLCGGYYIEATTINECVHTFCRSCILKHLQSSKHCPRCRSFGRPVTIANLRVDRTLRALVYKLVPGLYQSEKNRLVKHNCENNIITSSEGTAVVAAGNSVRDDSLVDEQEYFSPDEPISLSLEYHVSSVIGQDQSSMPPVRYLQCPAAVTIRHLQRFLSSKYDLNVDKNCIIDIIYEDEIIPTEFCLMDIAYCYKWERLSPMRFFYRIYLRPFDKFRKPEHVAGSTKPEVNTQDSTIVSTKPDKNLISKQNEEVTFGITTTPETSTVAVAEAAVTVGTTATPKQKSQPKSQSKKKSKLETTSEPSSPIIENNNNNNTNENTKTVRLIVKTPQKPPEFKILRSNDIRYNDLLENHLEMKGNGNGNGMGGGGENTLKVEKKKIEKSVDGEFFIGSVGKSQKRGGGLKRKYSKVEDFEETSEDDDVIVEEEVKTPKSTTSNDSDEVLPLSALKKDVISNKKSSSSSSSKKKDLDCPRFEIDLPTLKGKITVPKNDSNFLRRSFSDDVTTSGINQVKYAKTIGLLPRVHSVDEKLKPDDNNGHHHHHHYNYDIEGYTGHKKRKKAKHSKEPKEAGSSKRRKLHAEISPQNESDRSSDQSLKLKVKIMPNKPKKSSSDESSPPPLVIERIPSPVIITSASTTTTMTTLGVTATSNTKTYRVVDQSVPKLKITTPPPPPVQIQPQPKKPASLVVPPQKLKIVQEPPKSLKLVKTAPTPIGETEKILAEMRAKQQFRPPAVVANVSDKPMVNIPNLNQAHLENKESFKTEFIKPRNTVPMSRPIVSQPKAMQHQQPSKSTFHCPSPRPQQHAGNTMPRPMMHHYAPRPQIGNFVPATTKQRPNKPMLHMPAPRPNLLPHQYQMPRTPHPMTMPKQHLTPLMRIAEESKSKASVFDFKTNDVNERMKKFVRPSVSASQNKPQQNSTKPLLSSNGNEAFFKSTLGSSYIQENQTSKPMPMLLPPSSISVTKMTDNMKTVTTTQSDTRPSLEIVRISSNVPAIDQQQLKPLAKISSKPNRPPPPLIKRTATVATAPKLVTETVRRISQNHETTGQQPANKTVERKNSVEGKAESPKSSIDNVGALDLSGKSSRSPSAEKSPGEVKRNSSTDDSDVEIKRVRTEKKSPTSPVILSPSTTPTTTTSPQKFKQKKITDIFSSREWTINKTYRNSVDATSQRNNEPTNKNDQAVTIHEVSKPLNTNDKQPTTIPALLPATSETSIFAKGSTIVPTSQPPKLNELSKQPRMTTTTHSVVRQQQNLSMRNIPNPSALAFRNQQNHNTLVTTTSHTSSSTSHAASSAALNKTTTPTTSMPTSPITIAANSNPNSPPPLLNPMKSLSIFTSSAKLSSDSNKAAPVVSPSSPNKKNEPKGIERVVAHLKANAVTDAKNPQQNLSVT